MKKTPNRLKKNEKRSAAAPTPAQWSRADVESVLGTVMMCAVSLAALLLALAVFVSAVKMN